MQSLSQRPQRSFALLWALDCALRSAGPGRLDLRSQFRCCCSNIIVFLMTRSACVAAMPQYCCTRIAMSTMNPITLSRALPSLCWPRVRLCRHADALDHWHRWPVRRHVLVLHRTARRGKSRGPGVQDVVSLAFEQLIYIASDMRPDDWTRTLPALAHFPTPFLTDEMADTIASALADIVAQLRSRHLHGVRPLQNADTVMCDCCQSGTADTAVRGLQPAWRCPCALTLPLSILLHPPTAALCSCGCANWRVVSDWPPAMILIVCQFSPVRVTPPG